MDLIQVTDLTKTYLTDEVETPVLRGVSFSIRQGEFVAIMGPSGSGKSTLLHILGFLDFQTAGNYYFDGRENTSYDKKEVAQFRNKRLGFIFQAFNLLPRTTVLQNVMLPLFYSDTPRSQWEEKARAAIAAVGLMHRINHESSQLSGGEKQRVAIARALVNSPDVIFADEPTGNLDSASSALIMESIRRVHEAQGHTVILITHETYTAEYANRIIRIKDGRIESDTTVQRSANRGHYQK